MKTIRSRLAAPARRRHQRVEPENIATLENGTTDAPARSATRAEVSCFSVMPSSTRRASGSRRHLPINVVLALQPAGILSKHDTILSSGVVA
jgi:hypothetical protein